MAGVFVSFTTSDLDSARRIADGLEAAGFEPFLDRDVRTGIGVGEDWKDRRHRELRRNDAVVAVVSTASTESSWCSAEIAVADSLGCRILPVQIEEGVIHPLLGHLQHAPYAADPAAAVAQVITALQSVSVTRPRPSAEIRTPGSSRSPQNSGRCSTGGRPTSGRSPAGTPGQ